MQCAGLHKLEACTKGELLTLIRFPKNELIKSHHMYRVVQVAFGFGNAFFASLIMLSVSLAVIHAQPLFPGEHMIALYLRQWSAPALTNPC